MTQPPKPPWQQRLRERRQQLQSDQRWRTLRENQGHGDFTSNDYLGLSQHPDVRAAAADAVGRWGTGAGGSPLLHGYLPPHRRLAATLAEFLGWPRVLLFPSGFQANLAVLTALHKLRLIPVLDRHCHASLYAGASHGGRRVYRFRHNDPMDLQRQLSRLTDPDSAVVVTEGVFSMTGTQASLAALQQSSRGSAGMLVDDAHGLGVTGKTGRGVMDVLQASDLLVLTGTFGKALGHSGAFVATHPELADWLVNTARPYIYSTAFSPAQAVSIQAALQLMIDDAGPRQRLHTLIQLFRQQARATGLPFQLSDTPIQALVTGTESQTLALSAALERYGYWLPAIRPPTVPPQACQLRITLNSNLSPQRVIGLVQTLARLWSEYSDA